MQRKAADADTLYQAVMGQVATDPGLMMDRARYLRAKDYDRRRATLPRARTISPTRRRTPNASTTCC